MKAKYLLLALVLLSFVLMAIPAFAGGEACSKPATGSAESKKVCSNPIGDTIDSTPSIKEMQSKPARPLSYTVDAIGNRVPTQTDNSGHRN
jgi:hypothetical protein